MPDQPQYNYESVCDELIYAEIIKPEEIWYPKNCKSEFEQVYTSGFFFFAQDALNNKYKDYDIHPARFCFLEEDALNAQAWYKKGYFAILINIGVVRNLGDIFEDLDKDPYFQDVLKPVHAIEESLDLFMQKFALLFIMEHERAHLSQFSRQLELEEADYIAQHGHPTDFVKQSLVRSEKPDNNDDVDPYFDHLLEMDADLAAISLYSSYLLHSIRTKFNVVPYDHFHDLFGCCLAAVMILFHYWFNNEAEPPIYFDEEEHPHPVVRTAYCWEYFLQILHNNEHIIGFQVDIERIKMRAQTIRNHILLQNDYEDFDPEMLEKNADEIRRYLDYLDEGLDSAPETFQYVLRQRRKKL